MQAALLPGLLVAAVLSLSACGGGGHPEPPRKTATPAARSESPTATASPTAARRVLPPGPPLTTQAVLERIAGKRIRAAGRTVRVDADTVTCGGLDRPAHRRHGQPAWTSFRCIQPTFPPGGVSGPDLIFVVQSVAPRKLVVTRRHFTSY